MAARDVLVGEAAEGRPLEVLASEDKVGRRAEDEGQPLEILTSEDEVGWRAEGKGRPPDVLAGAVAGSRTSLPASDWAGQIVVAQW